MALVCRVAGQCLRLLAFAREAEALAALLACRRPIRGIKLRQADVRVEVFGVLKHSVGPLVAGNGLRDAERRDIKRRMTWIEPSPYWRISSKASV
jgi:hypothetical protein